MKKIKILTPMLAAAALPCSLISFTSCGSSEKYNINLLDNNLEPTYSFDNTYKIIGEQEFLNTINYSNLIADYKYNRHLDIEDSNMETAKLYISKISKGTANSLINIKAGIQLKKTDECDYTCEFEFNNIKMEYTCTDTGKTEESKTLYNWQILCNFLDTETTHYSTGASINFTLNGWANSNSKKIEFSNKSISYDLSNGPTELLKDWAKAGTENYFGLHCLYNYGRISNIRQFKFKKLG